MCLKVYTSCSRDRLSASICLTIGRSFIGCVGRLLEDMLDNVIEDVIEGMLEGVMDNVLENVLGYEFV